MSEQKVSKQQLIIGAVIAVAVLLFLFGGGLEMQAASELQDIHDQVAEDAVKQYQIAKRNGSAVDACVAAGLVTASYLQANDEANYKIWKQTESADCKRAGISY